MLAGVVKVLCSVRSALTTTAGISVAANNEPDWITASITALMGKNLNKRTPNDLEATRKAHTTDHTSLMLSTQSPTATWFIRTLHEDGHATCGSNTTGAGLRTDGLTAYLRPSHDRSQWRFRDTFQLPLRGQFWT
jgi:hypothetical protein